MPGREEIVRSLFGAWWLAQMDPRGIGLFNLTIEGFWRSFFAAVLVAPMYAAITLHDLLQHPDLLDPGWALLVKMIAYALAWIAFPVAAAVLTRLLDLHRHYAVLIIAGNWAAVLQATALLVVLVIGLALPDLLAQLLLLAVTIAILFYQWFVTRTALRTTGGIALALVLVDLLLNTAINVSAERLI